MHFTVGDVMRNLILIIIEVMNVEVDILSANAVRVSWDSINIPEVTGYTVYYTKTRYRTDKIQNEDMAINLTSSLNSLVFIYDDEYRFQVIAVADLEGIVMRGQRSTLVESPNGEMEFS